MKWILLFTLFMGTCAQAQHRLTCTVSHAETKAPLAFANIRVVGGSNEAVIADIDGHFTIKSSQTEMDVKVSFVGYETQVFHCAANSPNALFLKPLVTSLNDVTIVQKENPAWRIIRKTIANIPQNNPENYPWFSYQCYNKVQYNISGQKSQEFRKELPKKLQESPLFLMESVTERTYEAPNQSAEKIIATKVSGFKNPTFASLATDLQPFSFYKPHVDLLNIHFLNPIAKGSLKHYHYSLKDTLYQHKDTVFVIAYRPKIKTSFEGLTGVLYINTQGYAVQNVTAEPFELGKIRLKIEQKYALTPSGKWFPEQLNYVLAFTEVPSPDETMFVQGKSYLTDISFTPPQKKTRFPLEKVWIAEGASQKDSLYWQQKRKEPLVKAETNTYAFLDSLGEKHHFDRYLGWIEKFGRGRLPLGKIDIDLSKTILFNRYEGTRWGTGILTSDTWLKRMGAGAFAGYGQKDYQWKYGGSAYWIFYNEWRWRLDGLYEYNLHEWGSYGLRKTDAQTVNLRNFMAWQFDEGRHYSGKLSGYLSRSWHCSVALDYYETKPTYMTETVWPLPEKQVHRQWQLGLRYEANGGIVRTFGQDAKMPTNKPIVELLGTMGDVSVAGTTNTYHKLEGRISHTFFTPAFGNTSYRIEGGLLDKTVPLGLAFTGYGSWDKQVAYIIKNYFQTLQPYELIYDRFVQCFIHHSFEGLLIKKGKFQPVISVHQNMAMGDVREQTAATYGLERANGRVFMESGLQIDQLLKLNYLDVGYIGFGMGGFYRYGPYQLPNSKDNFVLKFSVTFSIR